MQDLLSFVPVEWLSALPPRYLALLLALTSVVSGSSALSGAIKGYHRSRGVVIDPASKLGRALKVLDWLAWTSSKVHDRALIAQHERTIDNQHGIIADANATTALQASVIKSLQKQAGK